MIDEKRYDQLNERIDSIVARGEFASSGDEEVDVLARVASGLRGLPDPRFRERLRAEFQPQPEHHLRRIWQRPQELLGGQAVFLAGGASSGLVGGACCVSGFTVHVLGLASASAVTTYIHSTIPYFIALSLISLVAWLAWLLRDQGYTLLVLATTARRHGLALAASYGAVFGSSMALTMMAGLY